MSRLVVVSNRVAPIDEGKQSAGGLAVAVLAALKKTGGIWFGWSGDVVAAPPSAPSLTPVGKLTYATLDLAKRDYEEYYNGYANSTLWPLFHFRLGLTNFNRRNYAGYQRVNALFASKLAPLLKPDDMVWVHDYHLIPFGEQLRLIGMEHRMGFFLHTPFPAPELLVALPNHADIVRALCAYDVVGFHTATDLRCFINYIRFEVRGTVTERPDGEGYFINAFGRTLVARAFPISIDTEPLVALAKQAAHTRQTERLRESLVGRDLIIGVDRLDYSKGLPQRFESFHCLLENYPANRGHVSFLQIAPPSRSDVPEYIAIRKELETLSGHINGRFAEFDWVPIRYLNKSFTRRSLAGFFRVSAVGLVTPLARRHEPCRQGICRLPGPGRPRRAGAVPLRRGGGGVGRRPDRQSLRYRIGRRRASARPHHAIGGAQGALQCHDGGPAAERYLRMAGEFRDRPDGSAVR